MEKKEWFLGLLTLLNSLWVCGSYFVLNILVHIQVCWCGRSSQKAKCLLKVNQIVKLSVRFLRETDFIDHIWHRIQCTKSCTAAGMRFVALVFLWYYVILFSIANVYLKVILKHWAIKTLLCGILCICHYAFHKSCLSLQASVSFDCCIQ